MGLREYGNVPPPTSDLIRTGNGLEIAASFFAPDTGARAAVLIVPAMGTGQSFYAPLAKWLAAQGFLVATFDYSGTGRSRRSDIRQLSVNLIDWGRFDCSSMVEELSRRLPGPPLYWVGHSMGGQLLAFVSRRDRITRAVHIATGSGYWRENSPALRWKVWWLWFAMAPISLRLLGYYPGRRLRKVGDLPPEVMRQWRRWCLNPRYAVGAEGETVEKQYASVTTPITSISFTDDEMMSARNVESIHSFYVNAPRRMIRIAPREAGVKRIGHFGFFRHSLADSLWKDCLVPELT